MAWVFDSDRPIYLQIADRITEHILTGRYPAGGKLPSVRDLALEAAVNPNTMQRAMSELESESLITTQRSTGRSVTTDEAVISAIKIKSAGELTAEYLKKMAAIGFQKPEASDFFNNFENGGTSYDSRA